MRVGLFVHEPNEGQVVVNDRELVAVGKLIVARLISGSLGSSFASGANVTIKPSS